MPATARATKVPITTVIRAMNLPYFFIAVLPILLKLQYSSKPGGGIRTFWTFFAGNPLHPQVKTRESPTFFPPSPEPAGQVGDLPHVTRTVGQVPDLPRREAPFVSQLLRARPTA